MGPNKQITVPKSFTTQIGIPGLTAEDMKSAARRTLLKQALAKIAGVQTQDINIVSVKDVTDVSAKSKGHKAQVAPVTADVVLQLDCGLDGVDCSTSGIQVTLKIHNKDAFALVSARSALMWLNGKQLGK